MHEDALQRNEFASRAVLCLVDLPDKTMSAEREMIKIRPAQRYPRLALSSHRSRHVAQSLRRFVHTLYTLPRVSDGGGVEVFEKIETMTGDLSASHQLAKRLFLENGREFHFLPRHCRRRVE